MTEYSWEQLDEIRDARGQKIDNLNSELERFEKALNDKRYFSQACVELARVERSDGVHFEMLVYKKKGKGWSLIILEGLEDSEVWLDVPLLSATMRQRLLAAENIPQLVQKIGGGMLAMNERLERQALNVAAATEELADD